MRKETSAGVVAGAVSGVPAGLVFGVLVLLATLPDLESHFSGNPNVLAFLPFLEVVSFVMCAALGSFFGAIAGYVFVKAINKLPFTSTYFKAALPWGILLFVSPLLAQPNSANEVIDFITRDLLLYASLVADAILFAYLFNRWTNHEQSTTR